MKNEKLPRWGFEISLREIVRCGFFLLLLRFQGWQLSGVQVWCFHTATEGEGIACLPTKHKPRMKKELYNYPKERNTGSRHYHIARTT